MIPSHQMVCDLMHLIPFGRVKVGLFFSRSRRDTTFYVLNLGPKESCCSKYSGARAVTEYIFENVILLL